MHGLILIQILGFWSPERLDGWMDDPHPDFRVLEFLEAGWMEDPHLDFRVPESREAGWMGDPHPDFRVLESERQRRRGRSEEEQCRWRERERERACCRALIAQHSFAMFACFLGSNTCSAYA
jgi:hypothetical protein